MYVTTSNLASENRALVMSCRPQRCHLVEPDPGDVRLERRQPRLAVPGRRGDPRPRRAPGFGSDGACSMTRIGSLAPLSSSRDRPRPQPTGPAVARPSDRRAAVRSRFSSRCRGFLDPGIRKTLAQRGSSNVMMRPSRAEARAASSTRIFRMACSGGTGFSPSPRTAAANSL